MRTSKALTLALALLWPVAGSAQDRAFDRGFVDVNAVSQASSSPRVRHMLRYPPSDPTQRYQVGYEVPDGPAFDISGGMRISPNLSVGLAVSRFGRSSRTDVDSVDVFARRGTVVHLGHRQRGYHLQTSWVVRVADRLDVAFFAGPSLFSVLQTRVTDVGFSLLTSVTDAVTLECDQELRRQADGSRLCGPCRSSPARADAAAGESEAAGDRCGHSAR